MGLNEPACTSIGKSKTTTTAETSSKRTGRARRATTTSAKSTGPSSPALTLCVADSPVSRSPWPGSDEARQMTVTSGRKWSAALTLSGPLGSLAKMCLESSIWASTKCVLTWKVSATPSGRCVYRLVPSMRRTSDSGSGSSVFIPTPNAVDGKGGGLDNRNRGPGNNLRDWFRQTYGFLYQPVKAVESMMGYPTGWTALKDSATPSSRKSRRKSGK